MTWFFVRVWWLWRWCGTHRPAFRSSGSWYFKIYFVGSRSSPVLISMSWFPVCSSDFWISFCWKCSFGPVRGIVWIRRRVWTSFPADIWTRSSASETWTPPSVEDFLGTRCRNLNSRDTFGSQLDPGILHHFLGQGGSAQNLTHGVLWVGLFVVFTLVQIRYQSWSIIEILEGIGLRNLIHLVAES